MIDLPTGRAGLGLFSKYGEVGHMQAFTPEQAAIVAELRRVTPKTKSSNSASCDGHNGDNGKLCATDYGDTINAA